MTGVNQLYSLKTDSQVNCPVLQQCQHPVVLHVRLHTSTLSSAARQQTCTAWRRASFTCVCSMRISGMQVTCCASFQIHSSTKGEATLSGKYLTCTVSQQRRVGGGWVIHYDNLLPFGGGNSIPPPV